MLKATHARMEDVVLTVYLEWDAIAQALALLGHHVQPLLDCVKIIRAFVIMELAQIVVHQVVLSVNVQMVLLDLYVLVDL